MSTRTDGHLREGSVSLGSAVLEEGSGVGEYIGRRTEAVLDAALILTDKDVAVVIKLVLNNAALNVELCVSFRYCVVNYDSELIGDECTAAARRCRIGGS